MQQTTINFQVDQMVAIIEFEAGEKLNEMNARCDEEFNIEKGRLLQEGRLKVKDNCKKKLKRLEAQTKTYVFLEFRIIFHLKILHRNYKVSSLENYIFSHISNLNNQERLHLLKVREDLLGGIVDSAKMKFKEHMKNMENYSGILQQLIAQGLYQV